MSAPSIYADRLVGTEPEPFDWDKHNREMDARRDALEATIKRWRKLAENFGKDESRPYNGDVS